MLTAIVCELEGVVVDTTEARARANARARRETGTIADDTDRELLALRGERALDDELARVIRLVSGARDALLDLSTRARVVVATRLPRVVTDRVMTAADLDGIVVAAIANDAEHPDDATRFTAALARLARTRPVSPDGAVALVDSAHGIAAAAHLGVRAVAVGPHVRDAVDTVPWVASIATLTYDALVQLLERSGVRPT